MLEFAVIQTDKGQALDILRHQQGASAAVFLGDDVTDEKAFRRLHGPDVGIKVGPGETLAALPRRRTRGRRRRADAACSRRGAPGCWAATPHRSSG